MDIYCSPRIFCEIKDGVTAQMVRLLQFLPPAQRIGLDATEAVRGEMSRKLNIPAVPRYGVKTVEGDRELSNDLDIARSDASDSS